MTIAVVVHQLDRSGGCRVLLQASQALAEVGHDVTIIVPNGARLASYPITRGVVVAQVGPCLPRLGGVGTLLRTLALILWLPRVDLALFSNFLCAWPMAVQRVLRRVKRVIYFVQANEPLAFGRLAHHFALPRYLFAWLSYRLPFDYLCNSTYVAQMLLAVHGKKAGIVHPGTDLTAFSATIGETIREKGVIAVVASSFRTKGWRMVVDTLRFLSAKRDDFSVVAFGPGAMPGLESIVDRVSWTLPVGDDQLARILGRASIFFSSSISEGFGLLTVESMAVGTPVVATDSGGSRDIIVHEKNGLLVSYGDCENAALAMMRLLDDENLQERLRVAGLETAARFSLVAFKRRLLQALGVA